MRYTVILLIFAAVLTVLGTQLSQHDGIIQVIINGNTWTMPIWGFLVRLLLLLVILAAVGKLLWTVIRMPKILRRFGKNRRQVVAGELLQKGMLAMGKGQWQKAEKLLVRGSRVTYKAKGDPGLFLSSAAQAAQYQGATERRDQYLLEARQLSVEGTETLTSALAEARLHLEAGEIQAALDAISPQKTLYGQNPQLLAIETEAYEQLGDYQAVWDLLPDLRKQFPSRQSYQKRRLTVAKELFIDEKSSLDYIEKAWSELTKVQKSDDGAFLNYISGLIHHGQEEKAEKLLAQAIRRDFSDPVIHAYTQLDIGSSSSRLDKMKHWLKFHPDNPYLNYGAAKLAFQSGQHETAKQYAVASVKSQSLPEAFALLGKIYEALGESGNALQAYKGSVELIYAEPEKAVSGEVLSASAIAALPDADEGDTEK